MPALALSATIYVPDDYPTIQEAIDASANGDTVIVRAGTYVENIDFNGKAITLRSEAGPEKTTIDGNDSGSTVTFQSGEVLDTALEGFTISNGSGTAGQHGTRGGGIHCINHSSPLMRDNIITGNRADYLGGGIFMHESDFGRFTNNVVVHNDGGYGGGVAVEGGAPIVANSIISLNGATSDGGGCHLKNCQARLLNCLIVFNGTVYWDGGGVWCWNVVGGLIANCNIMYNSVGDPTSWGGGIEVLSGSPLITNCIVRENDNEEISSGTVTYSNVKGGYPGTGNIDEPPYLMDIDGPDNDPHTWADNDYHIQYTSPCRDAGNVVSGMPGYDMEGDPRAAGLTADIGMDEFHTHLYVVGDFAPGGGIEGKVVGLPGTTPTGLFIGSGILDPALPTAWGDFHLQAPWLLIPLIPIPKNGILVLPATIPASPAAPYDLPMQALVGLDSDSLTNLFVLEVR
jgi:hypothetical protein